jgi:Fe(3+) dicitrate transport protein
MKKINSHPCLHRWLMAAVIATLAANPAWSQPSPASDDTVESTEPQIELSGELPATLTPVAILGSADAASRVPGGATYISEQDLEKFEFTDIQRILRQVPGVSIQIEDGFGLRPNISIRGTPSDRSARITLLEDGVPIAPAPYSAPAAYYFPTPGRMQSIEVLKGPAAILQGPYTTGGAINMISTRIPDSARGQVTVEAGSHGHLRGHAWYGDNLENFGYVFEGQEWRSDGFQDIDRSSRDTGLNKSDYMARFRINTSPGAVNYHALELKLQDADETSNQTYFGLTDADFDASPNRRYGVSELDQIQTEHEQLILSYTGRFGDWLELLPRLVQDRGHRSGRQPECAGVQQHRLVRSDPGNQPGPVTGRPESCRTAGDSGRHGRYRTRSDPDPQQCTRLFFQGHPGRSAAQVRYRSDFAPPPRWHTAA